MENGSSPLRTTKPFASGTRKPDNPSPRPSPHPMGRGRQGEWPRPSSTPRIWSAATGQPLVEPMHLGGEVKAAEFSSDGTRIVTADSSGVALIWRVPVEATQFALTHRGALHSAQFSADGLRVITASDDQTARIWDAHTGGELTPPLQHPAPVVAALFSRDGQHALTASKDGIVHVWD